jgi:hypothetical protein
MQKTLVSIQSNNGSFIEFSQPEETVDQLLKRVETTYHIPRKNQRVTISTADNENNELVNQSCDIEFDNNLSVDSANYLDELNIDNYPWLSYANAHTDNIIYQLLPTLSVLTERKTVIESIRKYLGRCLGARVFCIGSSMNNMFLPEESLTLSPFLCKGQEDRWFLRVTECFSTASINPSSSMTAASDIEFKSISLDLHNATISVVVNNLNVNIIHNELSAVYCGAFYEDINSFLGQNCIFRRSILLIKAWCCYDSAHLLPGM